MLFVVAKNYYYIRNRSNHLIGRGNFSRYSYLYQKVYTFKSNSFTIPIVLLTYDDHDNPSYVWIRNLKGKLGISLDLHKENEIRWKLLMLDTILFFCVTFRHIAESIKYTSFTFYLYIQQLNNMQTCNSNLKQFKSAKIWN